MEWNAKAPLQWDWENLIMYNATAAETPRKVGPTEWEFDDDGGIFSGALYSSGVGGGSCGSASDLDVAGLSKSSKSTSISSSSVGEIKPPNKPMLEAYEGVPQDCSSKNEFAKTDATATCMTPEASICFGEPLLGLKLGKRTYFEDVCVGSNAKVSTYPVIPPPSVTPIKRAKPNSQSMQTPRCQVEGCNLDLSSAKEYHRKHRVCEIHSKYPKVIVGGVERRFCQQCSRFHGLSEFDEKKRSCRRRLSDHNVRRRKPQPEAVHLHPARIWDDGKQQKSFVWNRFPSVHTKSEEEVTWEDICGKKSEQRKGFMMNHAKFGGTDGQIHFQSNQLPNSINVPHYSNGLLASTAKVTTTEDLNQEVHRFSVSTNLGATQDFHCALSLLSNTSWGSGEPEHVTLVHPNIPQHPTIMSQTFPSPSSQYWETRKQSVEPGVQKTTSPIHGNNNPFQEFRQFRAAGCDGDFYPYRQN